MSDKTYNTIKNIALFAVPVTTFIASVCNACNVPYCDVITAVLASVDTLLGGIVIVAKKIYEENGKGE